MKTSRFASCLSLLLAGAVRAETVQITATAGTGGTVAVSPAAESYPLDSNTVVTVTATPAAGYGFVKWTGNVPDVRQYDAVLPLHTDRTRAVAAVFATAIYVTTNGLASADGTSWANATTLTHALELASDSEVNVLVFSNGVYQLAAIYLIDKPVVVRGISGDFNDVVLHCTGGNRAAVKITNGGAVLTALTVQNGCSWDHWVPPQAGNVWMPSGGTLANCRIAKNRQYGTNRSGAVFSLNGKIYRCVFDGNSSTSNFRGMALWQEGADAVADGCVFTNNRAGSASTAYGVVNIKNGVLRNSLIANNDIGTASVSGQTSGVLVEGGVMENCIVYGNTFTGSATANLVAGVRLSSGIVRNTIIGRHANAAGEAALDWTGTAANFMNCATTALAAGMTACQEFVYGWTAYLGADGVYTLTADSPAIDAGAVASAQPADPLDLNGAVRVRGEAIDLGPVEHQAPEKLICPFSVSTTIGFIPLAVTCTAHPTYAAIASDPVTYAWTFANHPSLNVSGTDKREIAVTLTLPGGETVTLTATTAAGETFTFTQTVIPSVKTSYVVDGNPAAAAPYGTWATAAATIQNALDAAIDGMEIIVSNGTYKVSKNTEISKDVWVRGLNGDRDAVVIDGQRKFSTVITATGKGKLASVTITGGLLGGDEIQNAGVGLKILSAASIVSNCVIRGNETTAQRTEGIGVYIGAGMLLDSVIEDNTAINSCRGVGLKMTGGTVDRCVIRRNVRTFACPPLNNDWLSAAGVCLYGGILANSIVADNSLGSIVPVTRTYGAYDGTGVIMAGTSSRMINCAVIDNTFDTIAAKNYEAGVLVRNAEPLIYNTLIAGNGCSGAAENNAPWNHSRFYNCAVPGSETSGMQSPVAVTAGDYVYDAVAGRVLLPAGSALNDKGLTSALTTVITNFDLALAPRVVGNAVDIGPAESQGTVLGAIAFTADQSSGFAPYTATLTATARPDGADYTWFVDGAEQATFANEATASVSVTKLGATRVTLVATGALGATVEWSMDLERSAPAHYVVTSNPDAAAPYTTWAAAATNVQDAIDVAAVGAEVIVSNGVHQLASVMKVDRAITVRGVTGNRGDVVFDGGRLGSLDKKSAISLNNTECVFADLTVSNFTFTGDYYNGGAIQNYGATITNCRVTACNVLKWRRGVAVQNQDGRLADVLMDGNKSTSSSIPNLYFDALGLYQLYSRAVAEGCQILGNTAILNSSNEGTFRGALAATIHGGVLRNSLVAHNTIGSIYNNAHGVVVVTGGAVENCSIVSNACTTSVNGKAWHGLRRTGGTVVNTLIDGNYHPVGTVSNWSGTASAFTYCCTTPTEGLGAGCRTATAGTWSFGADGRLRVRSLGPCYNGGTSLPWHAGAEDLYGNARVYGNAVDIGCVESLGAGTHFFVR